VAATAISVLCMICTLAFVNGFQEKISDKVFSFWGHIHLSRLQESQSLITEEVPLEKNNKLIESLKLHNKIAHIAEYATKSGVIEKNKAIDGILIKGLGENYDKMAFSPFLKQGNWIDYSLDTSYSKQILVSELTANALKIKLNDSVKIHFIDAKHQSNNVYRKLKVVGIYKTGIEEYDKLYVIADIRLIQKINNWNSNQIGGYELFLDNYKTLQSTNNHILDELPTEWISKTTKEIYPNIFDWLNIQDVNRNIVIAIMSIVAIINLISCLLILVLERTKMIGILKAMGARDIDIQLLFVYYAAIISIAGVGIGCLLGLSICWLQDATHFITLDESTYYISYAPVVVRIREVIILCLSTIALCFASILIPTFVVRKISPVKSIQFR